MSLAAELHNAHKERLARIDCAVAHREACAKAAQETAKTADLERYLSTITKTKPQTAVPETSPKKGWFQIDDDLSPLKPKIIPIVEIQRAVCSHFGITPLELLSKRRDHKALIPRQVAMYLCKQLTTRSLPEIGRMFGGMDHTTVLSNARAVEKRMREDWRWAFDVAHIEGTLA